ncbi:MAG: pyrroline-5-carboxylate reductase [Candidatus Pacebacteria bacterium]|nr:pyrroline-5-carboxylate reductase [Candidatus Paceibacterota bacterium]
MKLKNIKIGLIGCGTMGGIIVQKLLSEGVVSKSQIVVNDKVFEKARAMASLRKVGMSKDAKALVEKSDILVLAVKPQDFKDLAKEIAPYTGKKRIPVISIMAGVEIKTIRKFLLCEAVARVMPNMASRIGKGVSVWLSSPAFTQSGKRQVEIILRSLGVAIEARKEKYIDMATAVSGSGPAYVFLFQELFLKAAKSLGMPKDLAEKLSLETIRGAVSLQEETKESPDVLRKKVTSKGGTTERAIKVFQARRSAETFCSAVEEAFKRSQQLKKTIK